MDDLEAANERIDAAIEHETPLRRKEGRIYSGAAREFFGKIKALRGRGFSFVQICGAFEKAGILPQDSNPYSFRQAFLRELSKRVRAEELLKEVKNARESAAEPPAANAPARTNAPGKPDKNASAARTESDEEKVRRLTGTVVVTGLGKIVKHSDGSFEYN
jgi:ribosomal protein L12E/L44/L45/RPP1/RPP2